MNKLKLLALLIAAPLLSHAQVSGSGHVYCSGETAVLSVSASASSSDAGRPGAWFIAAHHPSDAARVAFLTPNGWVISDSPGRLIPFGEYPGGIPGGISTSVCAPRVVSDGYSSSVDLGGCGSSTGAWAGYVVKVGYGVLTPKGEELVLTRRERLDAVKPIMQQKGRWSAWHEDDNHMRRALVTRSMRDGRTVDILTVPSIECQMIGSD